MTAPAQPTLPEKLSYNPRDGYLRGPNGETWFDLASADKEGEALAAEIAKRYNAHAGLVTKVDDLLDLIENEIAYSVDDEQENCRDYARRVIEARALLAEIRGE